MAQFLADNGDMVFSVATSGATQAKGSIQLVGTVAVWLREKVTPGNSGYGARRGLVSATKAAATDTGFAAGALVYMTSTGLIKATATGNTRIGVAQLAAATGETSVKVQLNYS